MIGYGWNASIVQYDVLLMYPKVSDGVPYAELQGHCVGRECEGTDVDGVFNAALQEGSVSEDELSASDGGLPSPWGSSALPFPTFNGESIASRLPFARILTPFPSQATRLRPQLMESSAEWSTRTTAVAKTSNCSPRWV